MKTYRQILCIVLSALMLLSLCACGKNESAQEYDDNESLRETQLAAEDECTYTLESYPLPSDMVQLTAHGNINGRLLLGGFSPAYSPVLGWFKDDGELESFEIPEHIEYIYSVCPYEDGAAILAGGLPRTWLKDGIMQENTAGNPDLNILLYTSDGSLSSEVLHICPAGHYENENFRHILYADDMFYICSDYTLMGFSTDGTEHQLIDNLDNRYEFLALIKCSGQPAFIASEYKDGILSSKIYSIPADISQEPEEIFVFPQKDETQSIIPSAADYDIDGNIIVCDSDALYSISPDGVLSKILSWENMGLLQPYYTGVCKTEQGFQLFYPGQEEFTRLRYGKADDSRTELLIWTSGSPKLISSLVQRFNSSSSDYRAVVRRYDPNAFTEQQKIELANGGGPDIYFSSSQPIPDVKDENICDDLLPYFETDKDINTDEILPGVLNSSMQGGRLFKLPMTFTFYTFYSPRDTGITDDYTMAQLADTALSYEPPLFLYQSSELSRATLFAWACNISQPAFVDRDNICCHFDSDEYIDMLKGFKEFVPEESSNEFIPSAAKFAQIANPLRLDAISKEFGERNYTYIGGPDGNLYSGGTIEVSNCLSISSSSQHKDGAWQFVKMSLSDKQSYSDSFSGFPCNISSFDSLMDIAMSGELLCFGEKVQINEYDVQEFKRALLATTTVLDEFAGVQEIAREEAKVYFNDGCSAEEAAKNTQSRASIYFSEQYG